MYQQCTLEKAQCTTITTLGITPCYSKCKVWEFWINMLTCFQSVVFFVILCIVYFLRFIYGFYESDSRAVGTKFSTDILNE